ncbi:MAG: PAS domain S-box-containing protein [Lentimonas sp.]|jgi:PAS domain S-box-containing protein
MCIAKIKNFVDDLSVAARSRRHLLLGNASALLRWVGLEALLVETNGLIDRHNNYAEAHMGHLKQLEATLGSIQEAVIIFSENREIEYANESAKQLFYQGGQLKGQRLESVLRSPSLIEYLSAYEKDPSCQLQQLSLEREGVLLWFEVSCSEVREVTEIDDVSTLLVLHDITRLKQLEEIRRDLVANVSHELRTPITIIKGYTETLLEDNEVLTAEKRARFLGKIDKNTQRLHLLVEDLLILSRLESNSDQVKPSVESMQQLLDEILENYSSRLDEKKQRMVLVFDEQVREFAFDRFRIQQVFDNLIENVFSYAPDFTEMRLEVSYDKAEDSVRCAVVDDGPGMPEKDLPHIFERFYRVDKGRSYEGGGTGLGLSIMKHIVQQHGGIVHAESKLGDGTSIYFSLPYLQTVTSK